MVMMMVMIMKMMKMTKILAKAMTMKRLITWTTKTIIV